MSSRLSGVPVVVLTEAHTGEKECINGLHVLTFGPSGNWTIITFVNGETLVVNEHFDDVANLLRGDRRDTEHRKPQIEMVEQVTIEHGLAFAQGWYDGDMTDACEETEIMTWPGGDMDNKEAHFRYHDLTDEICANVLALVKRQIAEAFVRAANEVLDRERGK